MSRGAISQAKDDGGRGQSSRKHYLYPAPSQKEGGDTCKRIWGVRIM